MTEVPSDKSGVDSVSSGDIVTICVRGLKKDRLDDGWWERWVLIDWLTGGCLERGIKFRSVCCDWLCSRCAVADRRLRFKVLLCCQLQSQSHRRVGREKRRLSGRR